MHDLRAWEGQLVTRPKVLYVLHNHPAVRPGGAEAYGLELYEGMRKYGDFEPIILARTGTPMSTFERSHEGTPFAAVNRDPAQYFVYTEQLAVRLALHDVTR